MCENWIRKGITDLRRRLKFPLNLWGHQRILWDASGPGYKTRNKRRDNFCQRPKCLISVAGGTHFVNITNWGEWRQLHKVGLCHVGKAVLRTTFRFAVMCFGNILMKNKQHFVIEILIEWVFFPSVNFTERSCDTVDCGFFFKIFFFNRHRKDYSLYCTELLYLFSCFFSISFSFSSIIYNLSFVLHVFGFVGTMKPLIRDHSLFKTTFSETFSSYF